MLLTSLSPFPRLTLAQTCGGPPHRGRYTCRFLPIAVYTRAGGCDRVASEEAQNDYRHFAAAHADFVPVVSGPARNIVHGLREFQCLRKQEHERQLAGLVTLPQGS